MIASTESKQIQAAAAELASDIQSVFPALNIHFLIHRRGQRQDEIEKIIGLLNGHPASDAARDLLKTRPLNENSAFLGIAIGHERGLFGMKGKPSCLAFITLNLDQYGSREEAQYALFHLTGQFFDVMGALNPDSLRNSGEIILQPKRNVLSLARANMKADIFSALMMTASGHKDAIRDLARLRGMQTLVSQPYQRPEEYPYAISLDVTEFAGEQISNVGQGKLLKSAHQLSSGVSRTFDKQNFESWINFTSPAQTMAWSGATPDQILGAAIHSCPNPFIKSIGNLLAEVTQIEPADKDGIDHGFNPYVDLEINMIAHERSVEDTFEMVMIHSMEADSALPLIRVANNQNESMLKGKVLGWCAHALHASAKAYENARQRGVPAEQAARLEFESTKNQTDWKSLSRLNDHVLAQRRNGFAVTLSDLAGWCKTSVDLRPVMESINHTLADPGYARKLAATHDMPAPNPALAPKGPSHQPAFVPSMAMQPALAGPGLSLGGGGTVYTGRQQSVPSETTFVTEDD